MNRELNPHLFGGLGATAVHTTTPMSPQQEPSRHVPYAPIDVKALESQMAMLRQALIQMEKRNELMASKLQDVVTNVNTRMERFSGSLARLEAGQAEIGKETSARVAGVLAKVNERKVSDTKVQEMIDRHNTIVRNFENRLVTLQRIMTEQEMALHHANATLADLRR